MYDVLAGVKVVEVAEWLFVPATATILADWGADVVKIEHPVHGDTFRGIFSNFGRNAPINVMFESANRGKRSVGIDLKTEAGREVLYDLVRQADVFLTSFRTDARAEFGIEADQILAINPKIVYGRASGYGLRGPDADKGGFDWAATWARAGLGEMVSTPGGEPPYMFGSVGDLTGAATMAGAIGAALFKAQRTGKGVVVDNSLLSVGVWLMCQSVLSAPYEEKRRYTNHDNPVSPVANIYRTSDGRWLCLAMLRGDKWWPDLCRHIGRDDLIDDPRFRDQESRRQHKKECIAELDAAFAAHTYEEWMQRLKTMEGVWDPFQTPKEVAVDEQVLVNGYVTPVTLPDGSTYMGVMAPGQFDGELPGEITSAPEHGEHTEEVLLGELGYEWDRLIELKNVGAIS